MSADGFDAAEALAAFNAAGQPNKPRRERSGGDGPPNPVWSGSNLSAAAGIQWSMEGRLSDADRRLLASNTCQDWLAHLNAKAGRQRGKVSWAAHIIIRRILAVMRRYNGACQVALSMLAGNLGDRKEGIWRSAVQRIIKSLVAIGILEYRRTCKRGTDPNGPLWVQDMNCYRLKVPPGLRAWSEDRDAKRRKTSEDEEHRRNERRAQWDTYAAQDKLEMDRKIAADPHLAATGIGSGATKRRLAPPDT